MRSLFGVAAGPAASANETPRPGDPDARRYNVAPTQDVLAVRSDGDARAMVWLRWGLVPPGAKELKVGARMINARSETVFKRPAFAKAILSQRCLIPADGFIEWRRIGKARHPIHLRMADDQVFAMAGVWQRWARSGRPPVETCAILTTTANPLVAPIHDRMPVILRPDDYPQWLDPEVDDEARITRLLAPYPAEAMRALAIDPRVNDVAHDDPECLAEVEPPPPGPEQLGFGFTT